MVAKLHNPPATTPIISAAHVSTNPDAGVAATSPAIVPEQKPTIVNLRSNLQSSKHQTMPPNAAAIIEFQIATIARKLAPNALPPLKPSQPNHSKKVPRATRETLCGRKLSNSFSLLRPRTHENASPLTPDPISTGPPPAKSKTPHLNAHPLVFHTQQARGQYTRVVQQNTNTIAGKTRPRSARAPIKMPTVTHANSIWKKAYRISGMRGEPGLASPRVCRRPNRSRLPMYPLEALGEKASE